MNAFVVVAPCCRGSMSEDSASMLNIAEWHQVCSECTCLKQKWTICLQNPFFFCLNSSCFFYGQQFLCRICSIISVIEDKNKTFGTTHPYAKFWAFSLQRYILPPICMTAPKHGEACNSTFPTTLHCLGINSCWVLTPLIQVAFRVSFPLGCSSCANLSIKRLFAEMAAQQSPTLAYLRPLNIYSPEERTVLPIFHLSLHFCSTFN